MEDGTTYHFVTDGIEAALAQARAAAGGKDVAVMGGANTINQFLAAGVVDELRLHISPLTLGAGARLFEGVPQLKLEQLRARGASNVTHVTYRAVRAEHHTYDRTVDRLPHRVLPLHPGAGAKPALRARPALTVPLREALLSVVGNAPGLAVQALLVAVGLGAAVAASATPYTVLKVVGAAYVVWLGVQAVRRRGDARQALLSG